MRFSCSVFALFLISQGIGALAPSDLGNYDLMSLSREPKVYGAEFESSVEIERNEMLGLHVVKNFDMGIIELDKEMTLQLIDSKRKIYKSRKVMRKGALVVEKTDKGPFSVKLRKFIEISRIGKFGGQHLFKENVDFHGPYMKVLRGNYHLAKAFEEDGYFVFNFEFVKKKKMDSLVYGREQILLEFGDDRINSPVSIPDNAPFQGAIELDILPLG